MRLDSDFRVRRLLVWRRNTSEFLDFTGTSLLVQTLRIALLGNFERNVDKDFDKGNGLLITLSLSVKFTGRVAVGSVGRNEGRNGDGGRIGKELSDLEDTKRR